jgi:hypothetical protein
MKAKSYFLLFLFLAIASSCEKDQPDAVQEVVGQWNWIYSYVSINNPNPNTPQSTGINEILVYNSNRTWYKTQNNIKIDSGTYSIGHGSYTPYNGAFTYIYDSIAYYKNGVIIKDKRDYYKIFNDTLQFNPGFAGLMAKSDPTAGLSRFYKRQ